MPAHVSRLNGLSKTQRILENRIFREAYNQRCRVSGTLMLMYLRSGEGAGCRLGVVTSKRMIPRAVDRSRARRLMRESFRRLRVQMPADRDVVLVARGPLKDAIGTDVDRELADLARRLKFWTGQAPGGTAG
jgi:ribonuclease P protein component